MVVSVGGGGAVGVLAWVVSVAVTGDAGCDDCCDDCNCGDDGFRDGGDDSGAGGVDGAAAVWPLRRSISGAVIWAKEYDDLLKERMRYVIQKSFPPKKFFLIRFLFFLIPFSFSPSFNPFITSFNEGISQYGIKGERRFVPHIYT